MAKPVTIPNTFATATSSIPLANLDADFTAVANSINDANSYSNYASDTGSANAYLVALPGVTTTYLAGLRIQFKAINANTGASTINVNLQGAKNITFQNTSALTAGTIAANSIVDVMYDGTQFLLMNDPAGLSGGDVVGPASAINEQIALFDGTSGKLIKAATTGTGVVTALGQTATGSGAIVLATSATMVTPTLGVATATSLNKVTITAPASSATLTIADGKTLTASNTLALAGTDSTTMTFPDTSASIGYLNVPVNSQSTNYTAVLTDSGKTIFHPSSDNNARTFTIPANSSVAYPLGTVLSFCNLAAADVTIAITSDTLYWTAAGGTGSRTLGQYGLATAVKLETTTWLISGLNLS